MINSREVVVVNITSDSVRITVADLATSLIMVPHGRTANRVDEFSSPAAMISAGFLSTDLAYKEAVALMGQSRTPEKFKVGKILTDRNTIQKIVFGVVPTGGTFTITVIHSTTATTATIAYNATAGAVQTALGLLANIGEVTVTGDASVGYTIEFSGTEATDLIVPITCDSALLTAAGYVAGTIGNTVSYVQRGSVEETLVDAINAIVAADESFFKIILDMDEAEAEREWTPSEVVALAAVVEAMPAKVLTVHTRSADAPDSTKTSDIGYLVKNAGYTRTFCTYGSFANQYLNAAITGLQSTKTPGSSDYFMKTVSGITVENHTSNQRAALRAKRYNWYESISGAPSFIDGVMANGEWIDVRDLIDYLIARVNEYVFLNMKAVEKTPYDQPGLDGIGSDIYMALLTYGLPDGLVKDTIVVITPLVSAVPTIDKTERIARNFKFTAQLKGSVHKAYIDGNLYV